MSSKAFDVEKGPVAVSSRQELPGPDATELRAPRRETAGEGGSKRSEMGQVRHATSAANATGVHSVPARSAATSSGEVLRPVEELPLSGGDIDAGIELERATKSFSHNRLHFDAGTWRVLGVRKGSCCDRQVRLCLP